MADSVYIFSFKMEKLITSNDKGGSFILENTSQFVQNLHEKQKKDEQNRKRNKKNHAEGHLPNKQHN